MVVYTPIDKLVLVRAFVNKESVRQKHCALIHMFSLLTDMLILRQSICTEYAHLKYCSAAGHPCRDGTVAGQSSPGIRTQVRGCTTVR